MFSVLNHLLNQINHVAFSDVFLPRSQWTLLAVTIENILLIVFPSDTAITG